MNKEKTLNPWPVTIIIIVTGVFFAANNYKVAATMTLLMQDLQIGAGLGGWLMAIYYLTGIVLALPAGGIMIKTGPKALGLTALFFTLAGNIMGAFSQVFSMLLFSRFIEGIGFGLIGVIAPAIIAAYFPPEKRGLPMAIWSCWIGFGLLFILNIANLLVSPVNPASWKNVWWLTAGLLAAITILFALFVRMPKTAGEMKNAAPAGERSSFIDVLKSVRIWCLTIIFTVFAFGVGALTTFAPTYFQNELGFSAAQANSYSSLLTVGMISGGIAMGFILNRVKNRTMILIASMVLTAGTFYFIFEFTASMALAYMLAGGFILQMIPATTFTVAPEAVTRSETVGVAMGMIIIGQNIGGFFGPSVVGTILDRSGWHTATWVLLGVAAIGLLASGVYALAVQRA